MKKTIRRWLSGILILSMFIGVIPSFASAAQNVASGYCGGEGDGTNLEWSLDQEGTLTITGTGAMKDYLYAQNVPWHSQRSSIRSVIVCDGVTTIGQGAFSGYSSISSVSISDSVTTIRQGAFFACAGLTSIDIPTGVTTIGAQAFSSCKGLTSVEIANSVTAIHYEAFSYCPNLIAVEIPDSVKSIGERAFAGCNRLTAIVVHDENMAYCDDDGVLFNKEKTILHSFPAGKTEKVYEIPESVTTIGSCAFWACTSLISVKIPISVTIIDFGAFSQCAGLSVVEIPNSVMIIRDAAFQNCTNLVFVKIPDGVKKICCFTFGGCTKLTSIEIPASVTHIDDMAFNNCTNLTKVYFSGNAPSVIAADSNDPSFDEVATLYYIPNNTGWTDSADYDADSNTWNGYKLSVWEDKDYLAQGYCGGEGDGMNLEWFLDKEGTLTITGTGAMANFTLGNAPWHSYQDSIKKAVIDNGVTTIGDYAFYYYTNLTSVMLSNSVTTIGNNTFSNCDNLTSVALPDSVTTIESSAFVSCDRLKSITIPNGVTTIENNVFSHCMRLSSVTIPDGVTTIGDGAFYFCASLSSVTIPDSVIAIGKEAFSQCDSLTSVTIPDTVTTIGNGAFSWCARLSSVTLPNSVTTIGSSTFYHCDSLSAIVIPDSVTSIGAHAFYSCNKPTSVYFEGNSPTVGNANSSSPSFDATVTLYYIPGTTDWTDSDAYNATTGKWNGYKLAIWEDKAPIASGYCGDEGDGKNITWTLDAEGTLIIRGKGDMKYYMMAERPWYRYTNQIKTVIVENGITSISGYAFSGCKSLDSVIIADSVKTIYEGAFQDCYALTEIEIPDSVMQIEHNVFYGCHNLESASLPKGIVAVKSGTFWDCWKLKHIVIPSGVETIGEYVFWGCDKLNSIVFQGDAPSWDRIWLPARATIYYNPIASGWTTPEWNEYPCYPCPHTWETQTNIIPNGDNTHTTSVLCECGYVTETVVDKCDFPTKGSCMICGEAHTHASDVVVRENELAPTCKENGYYEEVVYCDICDVELSRQTKTIDKLTTHTAADPVQENEVPATCKDYGSYDEVTYCSVCELELSRVSHATDKLLTHTSSEPIRENEIAATCKEQGSYDEVVYCAVCEIELSRVSHSTEKTSTHTPTEAVQENKKAATCEQEGSYDEVIYCDVCEIELSRETKTTEKADCQPGEWIIDREATPWREGSKHKECINCGTVLETETIPDTHWGGSSGNRDPFPKDDDEEFDGNENPFHDIGKNNWFYKDVLFVYLNGLMNGVSNGRFNPNGETTRAMVITILWRLAGKPIVNSDVVFVDVPNNQWYTDAIRWAASEGIVGGVGGSKFAPDGFITREQLATMLYRYEAYANGETEANNETAFADHANVSSWAQDAVSWCSGNGIVNGKGENQFAPKDSSTRAELAAMLHRYIER